MSRRCRRFRGARDEPRARGYGWYEARAIQELPGARRVDSGYLSPSDAEALGRMILQDNAWDLYRLESRALESVSE